MWSRRFQHKVDPPCHPGLQTPVSQGGIGQCVEGTPAAQHLPRGRHIPTCSTDCSMMIGNETSAAHLMAAHGSVALVLGALILVLLTAKDGPHRTLCTRGMSHLPALVWIFLKTPLCSRGPYAVVFAPLEPNPGQVCLPLPPLKVCAAMAG